MNWKLHQCPSCGAWLRPAERCPFCSPRRKRLEARLVKFMETMDLKPKEA